MSYLDRLKQLESVKKHHYAPNTELTKPTKPPFGSFGSTSCPRIEKKHDDVETFSAWGAADWRAFFDERAAVAKYDGAIPRAQAEAQAWQCCIAEWLCRNPVTSDPGSCAQCGQGDLSGRIVMPYGDADHGHTHLHGECWPAWYAHQRQDAMAALEALRVRQHD